MKTYYLPHLLLSLLILSSTSEWCDSAIINLPEDYSSIQEAIEIASSGDVIQINQHDVNYLKEYTLLEDHFQKPGIRIVNKNLTIVGTLQNEKIRINHFDSLVKSSILYYFVGDFDIPPSSDKNSLVIENSEVVFKNLNIRSLRLAGGAPPRPSMISPFQVHSGKLVFENVIFQGLLKVYDDIEIYNSTILGDSYYYINFDAKSKSGKKAFPAIHIRNQESSKIKIINSHIQCDTDTGSRAIVIEKNKNANIQIIDSNIFSGKSLNYYMGYNYSKTLPFSYWDAPDNEKGLTGILIVDCTNVNLSMTGSISKGGERDSSIHQVIPAGPGIDIINSTNIGIYNGESRGHDGSIGWYYHYEDTYYHGGDGGNGLFVTNSTVHLYNHTAIGGKGGEGDPENDILPGQDGQPIYHDENSQIIYGTSIPDWMLLAY